MQQEELKGKVWVSEFNRRPEIREAYRNCGPVGFYDTTLRDGEQTVGVVFRAQQKVEIARHLDQLGVARIEAGFPRVSEEDSRAFQQILNEGLKAEIWGFSRAVRADLDELIRLGTRHSVIEVPTSPIKMEAYGLSPQKVMERAVDAVGHAKDHEIRVAFFPVDGTRSELSFLKEVYQAATEAGADEAVVVDTIGACGPEAVEFLVREIRQVLGEGIPLHYHGHNDFGLATASAVAAVRAGATWIQGTINGMGERAGNADICEIAVALQCLYEVPVDLNFEHILATSAAVQQAAGYRVDAWKPVVGENLFVRESGAVATQFHIPEAIEPFSAEIIGARRRVVLGKKSGLASIDIKGRELGLSIAQDKRPSILAEVKRQGVEKGRLITDDEFRRIVETTG